MQQHKLTYMTKNKEFKMRQQNIIQCGGRDGLHKSFDLFQLPVHWFGFDADPSADMSDIETITHNQFVDKTVIYTGVSNKKGTSKFFIYNHSDLSSLLKLNTKATLRYQDITINKTINIETDTLNNLFGTDQRNTIIDYLIIDVQGATYEVLEGSSNLLSNIKAIRCEVELVELYENQKLFGAVSELLKNNFLLARIETCGSGDIGFSTDMNQYSVSIEDSIPIYGDCIFINKKYLDFSIEEQIYLIIYTLYNGCGYIGATILEHIYNTNNMTLLENTLPLQSQQFFYSSIASYFNLERISPKNFERSSFDGIAIFQQFFGKDLNVYTSNKAINTKLQSIYNMPQ